MNRREYLGAITAASVPMAGCSSGDGGGGYSCPPSGKGEAGDLIRAGESDPFSIERGVWELDEARTIGDLTAPGASARLAGPEGDPYNVGVYLWEDESTATDYASQVSRTLSNWEGESVTLEAALKARVEKVTLDIDALRSEHRESMLDLLGAFPCFGEAEIETTSWE